VDVQAGCGFPAGSWRVTAGAPGAAGARGAADAT